jgi:hypothetical protein
MSLCATLVIGADQAAGKASTGLLRPAPHCWQRFNSAGKHHFLGFQCPETRGRKMCSSPSSKGKKLNPSGATLLTFKLIAYPSEGATCATGTAPIAYKPDEPSARCYSPALGKKPMEDDLSLLCYFAGHLWTIILLSAGVGDSR